MAFKKLSMTQVKSTLKKQLTPEGEILRARIIEYLADPENEIPTKSELASITLTWKTGRKNTRLSEHFSAYAIDTIYVEALAERRTRYAENFGKVDDAMFQKAFGGDVQAGKLLYQRFEGLSENLKVEHSISLDLVKAILDSLPPDYARLVYQNIQKKLKLTDGELSISDEEVGK